MTELQKSPERGFEIRCVWCGIRIRREASEDSEGICLKCFYRILNERLCAQRRARAGEGVSDR
jgi:hypothetical protein